MLEEIIQIEGKDAGPTSIILGGVHGDEICGVEVVKEAIQGLTIERGKVLLGFGNPRAIEANKRFTETNLNRMFRPDTSLPDAERQSYEYLRAQFLKDYLGQADALLDIHASSVPESRSFAICEGNAKGIIEFLPIDLVVSGFDEVEPGGTDYYMNSIGKIGVCLECGYFKDLKSNQIAKEGIYAFLKAMGHIASDLISQEQSHVRVYEKYLTKTDMFVLAKPFENFEKIKENQLIGTDGQKEIRATRDGLILFAHNRSKKGEEAFLLGKLKNEWV